MAVEEHPTYRRFLEEAETHFKVQGPKAVAAQLTLAQVDVTPQMMGNWKTRGVPLEIAVQCAPLFGTSLGWLRCESDQRQHLQGTGLINTAPVSREPPAQGLISSAPSTMDNQLRILTAAYSILDPEQQAWLVNKARELVFQTLTESDTPHPKRKAS